MFVETSIFYLKVKIMFFPFHSTLTYTLLYKKQLLFESKTKKTCVRHALTIKITKRDRFVDLSTKKKKFLLVYLAVDWLKKKGKN